MTRPPGIGLLTVRYAVLALGLFAPMRVRAAEPDRLPTAGDASWARVAVPSGLRAGERVTLAFGPAPAGVEELELLLSLDGGRSWPVRVTRERDPRQCSLDWLVPNLPAARAMVRIRYRLDGREIEGPPSRVFAIAGDPARGQDLDIFHEGNWWEGFPALGAAEAPALAGPDTPGFGRLVHLPIAEIPAPTAALTPPASRPVPSVSCLRLTAGSLQPLRVVPPFTPLRN